MDTKDLEAFLCVYREKSLNKAAQEFFISQQGLSKIIKKVESELGVPLFERTFKGVYPTIYGDVLFEKSIDIIKNLNALKENIKDSNKENYRSLNVVSTCGLLAYLTIEFIADFRNRYPWIELNITETPDKTVSNYILSEQADIGFIGGPINALKFEGTLYSSHRHCLVINKEHELSRKDEITYQDLDGEKIALEGREFQPFYNNLNRFLKAGVKPNIIMETTEIYLTHQIASMNKGIGLSVDFPALSNRYENTVVLPFSDDSCTWDTYLVTKKNKVIGETAEIFRSFAISWLAENKDGLFKWII